tara:strand:+ start:538 stop:1173 length:636 start_codon:yes stop_codon:yes gene_type:complete
MSHQIIDDLNWRYACKKFDPTKKLTEEQLNDLLDSLRLTASSYGIQPWKFVVVKNAEKREQLIGAAYKQRQVADASDLLVLCRPAELDASVIDSYIDDICKTRDQNKEDLEGYRNMMVKVVEKDEPVKVAWAKNQIYIALGTLMTACAAMRIDSCPMEGFSPKQFDEILELDKLGLKSVLVCPVGFRASDDKYIDVKKVRYSKDEIVTVIE